MNRTSKKKVSDFSMNNKVLFRDINKRCFQPINKVNKSKIPVSNTVSVRRQRNSLDDLI